MTPPINQTKNRGTGAGGKNTNVSGKTFEQLTCLPTHLDLAPETLLKGTKGFAFGPDISFVEQSNIHKMLSQCPSAKSKVTKKAKHRKNLRSEFEKRTTAEMMSFLDDDEPTQDGKEELFVYIVEELEKKVPKDENKERLLKLEYSPEFDVATFQNSGLDDEEIRKVLSSVFNGRTVQTNNKRNPDLAVLYWKPGSAHNCVTNLLAIDIMETKNQKCSGSVDQKLLHGTEYWESTYKDQLSKICDCECNMENIGFRYSMTLCDWFRRTSVRTKTPNIPAHHWVWMDKRRVQRFWGEDPKYVESVKKYIAVRRDELY